MNTKRRLIIGAAAAVLLVAASASLGSSPISPIDTVLILAHKFFRIPLADRINPQNVSIVWLLRLPRVLLAFLAGGCLAMSGAITQSVLRNPLASPYILGVSSGASLGAGLVIISGFSLAISGSLAFIGSLTLPLAGFACGLAAVFTVVALSEKIDKNVSSNTIILFGMVFSLFINALLTTLCAIFSDDLKRIVLWQMGSFAMKGWRYVFVLLPFFIIGTIGVMRYSRELDILSFGDEQAKSAGVEAGSVRKKLLGISAVLTGSVVALSGIIGFVDLIAPHAARKIIGNRHAYLLPMSFITGGSLMAVTDLLARTIISPSELPVGALTAIIGAPFFAWVYFRKRNNAPHQLHNAPPQLHNAPAQENQ